MKPNGLKKKNERKLKLSERWCVKKELQYKKRMKGNYVNAE